jgi:hypothetical protein
LLVCNFDRLKSREVPGHYGIRFLGRKGRES